MSWRRYLLRNFVLAGIGLFTALWLGYLLGLNWPAWLGLILVPLFLVMPHVVIPDAVPVSWRRFFASPKRTLLFGAVYTLVIVVISHLITGNWVWR